MSTLQILLVKFGTKLKQTVCFSLQYNAPIQSNIQVRGPTEMNEIIHML